MNKILCINPREELSGTQYVEAYIGPKAAVDAFCCLHVVVVSLIVDWDGLPVCCDVY